MKLFSQKDDSPLDQSMPRPVASGCIAIILMAFITLPNAANAWSWWSGWDSNAECMDYYTKNPALGPGPYYRHLTPEESCASKKAEEDEKLRKEAEIERVIVLGCRAESVTNAQFAACVELATTPLKQ